MAHLNSIGGQLGPEHPQRQIRLLGNPRQQPLASVSQTVRPATAHRQGRRASRRPETL
jgi:hypothetical protein